MTGSVSVLLPAVLAAGVVVLGVGAVALLRPVAAPTLLAPQTAAPQPVDRAARRLGRVPVRVIGRRADPYRRVLTRLLADAGRSTTPVDDFAEVHAGLVVLGLLGAAPLAAVGAFVPAGLLVVVTAALSPVRLLREARRRQADIERAMPAFLELMAVLLAAGLTFRHALARIVARIDGPLAEEMQMLLGQLEFGWTPDAALGDLLRRSSAPTVKRLVTSARQNLALGVPIATVLGDMAEDVRAEYVVALRIRAQRAVDRAAVVLVMMVMPAMLGLTATVLISEALDVMAELGL